MFDRLVGNERVKNLIYSSVCSGGLSHALIIEGSEGIGKHTLAYETASLMSGADMYDRIKAGKCPDVAVFGLGTGKKTVGIDTVRDIIGGAYVTPNEFDFKMSIIEDADKMTVQAQNAFLKLLEEPPENNYFLMLCENSSVLLPTIRSRASVIRMERPGRDQIDDWLTKNSTSAASLKKKNPRAYETVIRSADGSVGRAVRLCGKKSFEKDDNLFSGDKNVIEKTVALIDGICERKCASVVRSVSEIGSDRAEASAVLSSLSYALRDLVLCKTRLLRTGDADGWDTIGISLCFFEDPEKTSRMSEMITLSELMSACGLVSSVAERISANGNIRLCLTGLSSGLRKIFC